MELSKLILLVAVASSLALPACDEEIPSETDSVPNTEKRPDERPTPVSLPPESPPALPYLFVGIIDSGIEEDHPAFERAFASGNELSPFYPAAYRKEVASLDRSAGWDAVKNGLSLSDSTGHGTHVAGIVAAAQCIPNSPARLLIFRSGDRGHELDAVSSSLALLQQLKDAGLNVPVVLLPIEYYRSANDRDRFERFQREVEKVSKTSLVVTAAGNQGTDNDADDGKAAFPASFPFPTLLAVACTNGSGHLHARSNHGATSVDLGAPGFGIESAWLKGERKRVTGSSQAAAQVAARAIAILRQSRDLTPKTLRERVLKECRLHPSLLKKVASNGFLPVVPSSEK